MVGNNFLTLNGGSEPIGFRNLIIKINVNSKSKQINNETELSNVGQGLER